jgi:hypothetical protein
MYINHQIFTRDIQRHGFPKKYVYSIRREQQEYSTANKSFMLSGLFPSIHLWPMSTRCWTKRKLCIFPVYRCTEKLKDKTARILANDLGGLIHQRALFLVVRYRGYR